MKNGVLFEMDSVPEILRKRGLERGGPVQKYIDSEVLRLNEPYVPKDRGVLVQSGILYTDVGSGEVVYDTPYARFTYYGKVMVGRKSGSPWARSNETKVATSRDLTYHGGGMRGAMHFERMKADHKDDILRGAAALAGGKTE